MLFHYSRISSKPDLQQRNYTYISEFTTTLNNKPDKKKIINSFYRKIRQLEEKRNFLNVKETISSIDLTVHIYQCILHIVEKMDIDLVLYRGPKYKERYKISSQLIDIRRLKRRRQSKQENQIRLQNMFLNQNLKRINDLKLQKLIFLMHPKVLQHRLPQDKKIVFQLQIE